MDAPEVIVARQARLAPALQEIESFRPAPKPKEPVTDSEKALLVARRDAALAEIERLRKA